ncbi:hypothetical protein V5N11_032397 [Cardamine amara subsp. amara]|uniref:Uncharacterized protein n=1 Tax=Cardamine amara subsp. amara TaxID=228776 RepID=A0ABD1BXI5_CARAN
MATTGHERSKTLNNFSLPNLWGTQRHLRCAKIDESITGEQRRRRFRSSPPSNQKVESLEEEGIKEFREKIMLDLRTVADKMTESIFREQYNEEEEEKPPEKEVSPPGDTVEVRPWNLRKRRAACKAPISGNDVKNQNYEKKRVIEEEEESVKSSKLVYTLTKKEIEDDYMKMIGHRPPRRFKKRSRTLQKQIDLLNPASYITEITEDLYEVSDTVENGKR